MPTRAQHFLRSLLSGYAVLGANALYSLASVPLALSYLPKEQFGLWILAAQVGMFLGLVDLGMSAALSRELIEHKDHPEGGKYGSVIRTGYWVLAAQAALVFAIGLVVTLGCLHFMPFGPDETRLFALLMAGQCALLAVGFVAKMFTYLLVAHQRFDVLNAIQIVLQIVQFAVLWLAFHWQSGVFSLLWASGVSVALGSVLVMAACMRLKVLPGGAGRGQASWPLFRELFSFGRDMFWMSLGAQVVFSCQTVIVSYGLGLDMATTWAVCTRAFTLICMLLWRFPEFAFPVFSEMIVRGEQALLQRRVGAMITLVLSVAATAAVGLAVCNVPFVQVWTADKAVWPRLSDVFLGLWLLPIALTRCIFMLLTSMRKIGRMPYVYMVEGICLIVFGTLASRVWGFPGLLAVSALCACAFSGSYGVWRLASFFDLPLRQVVRNWLYPGLRQLGAVALVGGFSAWATQSQRPLVQFAVNGTAVLLLGGGLLLAGSAGRELRVEAAARAPRWLRARFGRAGSLL